jgi:hypothetical protein
MSTQAKPEISSFKGNKLLVLNPGAKFLTSFGLGKAKMIVQHYDAILAFVNSEGETCVPEEGNLDDAADAYLDEQD